MADDESSREETVRELRGRLERMEEEKRGFVEMAIAVLHESKKKDGEIARLDEENRQLQLVSAGNWQ